MADLGSKTPETRAQYRQRVRFEQLRLVYRGLPVVLTANLINGTLLAGLFSDGASPQLLFGWWLLLVTVNVTRACAWWYWHRRGSETEHDATLWRVISVAGSGASGVLWGAAGILFYVPNDALRLMALGFVLGGMGAGALASLTPHLWTFYAYLFPSVVPFTFELAVADSPYHRAMAVMCLLYLLSLFSIARRAHSWLVNSLTLSCKQAHFTQTLERRVAERTEELRETTECLYRDIAERQRAEQKLSDYGHRQAAVAAFGERALSGADVDHLFSEAATLVATRLDAAGVMVLELASERDVLFVRAAAGPLLEGGVDSPLPFDSSPAGFAVQEGVSVISDNLADEQRFTLPAIVQDMSLRSAAVVGISNGQHTFGALAAYDTQSQKFTADDVSFSSRLRTCWRRQSIESERNRTSAGWRSRILLQACRTEPCFATCWPRRQRKPRALTGRLP